MTSVNNLWEKLGGLVANRKTRWATIFIWILLIGIFSLIWPQVNDQATTDNQLLPDDAMSVVANDIDNKEFSDDAGVPLLLVWHRGEGLEDTDYEDIQAFYEKLDESPLDNQSFIPPFQDAPVEALACSASEDGAALITPVLFDEEASTDELQASLDQLSTKVTDQSGAEILDSDLKDSQLPVRFSGAVGIPYDAVSLVSNADVTLFMYTVLLVIIFLFVLYGYPILAIVPFVAVGIAYGIISRLLGFFAEKGWIVV